MTPRAHLHNSMSVRLGAVATLGCTSLASLALPPVAARTGELSLRTGSVQIAQQENLLRQDAFPPGHFVLTLNQPLTAARAAALELRGVKLCGYYPSLSYLVDLRGVSPAALRELDYVSSVVAFEDTWKIDPSIGTRVFVSVPRQQIAAENKVALRVLLFPQQQLLGDIVQQLSQVPGLTVIESEPIRDSVSFTATAPITSLVALASLDAVQYIEELPEFTPRDASQRWIVQSNVSGSRPLYEHGITGTNQIIGVIDGHVATLHCAFLDALHPIGPSHRKLLAYNTAVGGYDAHGTHVAAIAAGDEGIESANRGIAYDAKIVFNLPPSATQASYLDRFNLHYSQGARVHTNSWGNDATQQYDYACAAIDTFMHDNEDAILVFAVSNTPIVRNPENAKNSLAVTRTGNTPNQNQICIVFGSLPGSGPTLDGRRKPDIAAPGCNITSATGATACLSAVNSGTSMATPAIGGVAALIRQYFTEGFYPTGAATASNALIPSGALLKAMVVNSGEDLLSTGYPSNQEGWGRVLASSVLPFAGDPHHLVIRDIRNTSSQALSTDGVREFQIDVNDAAQIFRITMAYTDQPATLPATVTPVNDLDLLVISPGGDIFVGNNLVGGFSTPGGLPDPINNLEQVRIQSPAVGRWTIRIRGTAVNLGRQGFAISAIGAISDARCPADFNNDQVVDFFDYLDFVAAFSAGSQNADFNSDQVVDFFDYLDFVAAFSTPC